MSFFYFIFAKQVHDFPQFGNQIISSLLPKKMNVECLLVTSKIGLNLMLLTLMSVALILSNVVLYFTFPELESRATNLSLSILQGRPRSVAVSIALHHSLTLI